MRLPVTVEVLVDVLRSALRHPDVCPATSCRGHVGTSSWRHHFTPVVVFDVAYAVRAEGLVEGCWELLGQLEYLLSRLLARHDQRRAARLAALCPLTCC